MPLLAAMVVLVLAAATSRTLPHGALVDLSHPYDATTIYWPTESGFKLEKEHDGPTEQGFYYRANRFFSAEHGGTHIDAPAHFAEKGRTVDAIPLEQLVGEAVAIDVSRKCLADRDYRISLDDLKAWEKAHQEIPKHAIVLLRTGFAKYWPDRKQYLGTDERGPDAVKHLHFPGLDRAAAAWLIAEREVNAVGIDTASIDHGQSVKFETHVELMTHDVPALENLTNLERLPPTGLTVVALPMKIAGGSGAPVRAIAIIQNK